MKSFSHALACAESLRRNSEPAAGVAMPTFSRFCAFLSVSNHGILDCLRTHVKNLGFEGGGIRPTYSVAKDVFLGA